MLKKLLYSVLCIALFQINLQAQTSLFSEDFESGGSTNFSLNSTDMGGTATGENPWIINNIYAGGSGSFMCLGFPIPFTVPAAPQQPAGITNNPTSFHLHITPQIAIDGGGNLPAASYVAADGFCIFGGTSTFSRMTTDFSTVGYDSIEFDYWWTCGGSSTYYGELYYSTNGGSSWTLVNNPSSGTSQWSGQATWANTKISNPNWAQQATLRFGFRFVSGSTATGSELDPGYAVDDIEVTGFTLAPVNSIAAPTLPGTAYCPGDNLTINYSVSGTYNAGNTFTAELSDASGSFAAATAIGSVAATGSGAINATIPLAAVAGAGYRIRVVANDPTTTGFDNGTDITIAAGAIAGNAASVADTVCAGNTSNISLSGYTGTIVWEESNNGTTWAGSSYTGDNFTSNALSQNLYLRAIVQSSCGNDTSNTIQVAVVAAPAASFNYSQGGLSLNINFSNNTAGAYTAVSWDFGDGNSTTNDDPTHLYATAGSYLVSLTVTNAFGCSSVYTDTISVIPVAVEWVETSAISNLQILPNPNNGQFQVRLELAEAQNMQIFLTDLTGRRLSTLYNGYLPMGEHFIQQNSNHETWSSGLYILEVLGDKEQQRQKLSIFR